METRIWWVVAVLKDGMSESEMMGDTTVQRMMMACRGGLEPDRLEFHYSEEQAMFVLRQKLAAASERFASIASRLKS